MKLRKGSALAAIAGTAALVAGSAGAFVGEPGTGTPPTSSGPDLLSAEIIREVDPGDPLGPQARLCYDEVLNAGTIVPTGIALVNYDSNVVPQSTNSTIDTREESGGKCIIATFANGLEIGQSTVAVNRVSSVQDTSSTAGPQESAPLTGSKVVPTAGATTGPDLLSTSVDPGATPPQITYTFDENLDPALSGGGAALAAKFGFYVDTDNGSAPRVGGGIVGVSRNSIVVSFTVAQNVGQAKRFYVDPTLTGTDVRDRTPGAQVFGGPANTVGPIAAVGAAITGGPSLVSGAKQEGSNGQIVDLKFAQAVIPGPPGSFAGNIFAYRADAGRIPGTYSIGTSGADTSVLPLTMPTTTQDEPLSVVRVGLRPGVVKNQANDRENAFGSAAISTEPARKGFTDAPDLIRTEVNDATNRVTYFFDEALDDDPQATFFRVINSDASTRDGQAGTAVLSSDKLSVSVRFDGSVSGSSIAGVSNLFDTVQDRVKDAPAAGNGSSNGSVNLGVIACQPGTCPTPTPTVGPGTTPTPTPGPGNTTVTRSTKLSLSRKSGGKKYTGKLSSQAPCVSGRTVKLKKGSKTVGSKKVGSSGKFTIKTKKQKKGKIKATVASRSITQGTTTYKCGAASSKKR